MSSMLIPGGRPRLGVRDRAEMGVEDAATGADGGGGFRAAAAVTGIGGVGLGVAATIKDAEALAVFAVLCSLIECCAGLAVAFGLIAG